MTYWMQTCRRWLLDPEQRLRVVGFLLLAALLWEIQYAVRYMYLVPVWDIAAFQEILLYRLESQPDRSLWDVAVKFVVNGHWPLIPFFAYYADFAFDAASGRIPMWLSWLALLAIAPSVAWSVSNRGLATKTVIGLCIAIVMFWPAQMETVISPMQVLISFSLLFGALALRSATGAVSMRRLALTVLLAAASMFSFGYGVVLWPCIVVVFLLERRWRSAIAVTVLAVFALWSYQYSAVGAGFNPFGALMTAPSAVLVYTLAQAGSFFAYLMQQPDPVVAQIAGAVAVVVHGALTWMLWRSKRWPERGLRFLWLLAAWLIGMMLLTGLGRHSLGAIQAMNTRYLIVSSLYWISLFALAWRLADANRMLHRGMAAGAALAIAVLLAGVPTYVERMQAVRVNQSVATLALTLGVTEVNAQNQPHAVLHPWPLTKLYGYLRAQRMSVYREEWSTWLGIDFATLFGNAVPRRCESALDSRTPMREGERWIGWIHSPDTRATPPEVLFVHDGRIVGLAFTLLDRPEIATRFDDASALRTGYYGFLPTQASGVVQLYGHFSDGSICSAGSVPASVAAPAPAA